MTGRSLGAVVAIALAAGLALRLARLDARPMHNDEANQAIKFGELLERGEYRYDTDDHHGPTLYYLTLPAAALRGQATLASLDEWTLRGVTAAFGAVTVLLLPLLSAPVGRTAVAASAWLLALSPAMVFYSRMFIQESLFAFFTLAFTIGVGRLATSGGIGWSALAGAAAGLAVATKETSVIVLPAALAACAIALWTVGAPAPLAAGRWRRALAVGVLTAVAVAALFYSSFLASPGAVLDPFRAAGTYFGRGVDPDSHAHPWHFYLHLLGYFSSGGLEWTEALVIVLACVGGIRAWGRPDPARPAHAFWVRYLTGNVVIATAIFSAIPYKTPWNLLPFYVGAIVLAGVGFSTLLEAATSRALRAGLAAGLVLASAHLGWQAWRASVTYAADPRNPYVYAQTVPDAVRLAARIRTLAAVHADEARMLVSVIAPPHEQWPLPWYLREMPHVGYWVAPGDALALQPPVIVASMEHAAALDAALGDRYVSEFFGLRPEVLLALYVERGLWERFLATQAGNAVGPKQLVAGTTSHLLRADAGCGTVAGDERAVTPPELALVVPCYNEASRLDADAFLRFATTHPGVRLVVVDDGSADGTGAVLERLRAAAPAAVTVLRHSKRRGKAEAVRAGVLAGLEQRAALVGFYDADLSTPLETIDDFLAVLRDRPSVEFVLGSRVMLMGRDIKRKATRHYFGRVFATAVSHALDLPVYDTQCGAKILRVNEATAALFAAPFRSPWIFDVELIARYLRLPVAAGEPARRDRLYELVLPTWHDRPGSKLRWYDFVRAMGDLVYIWRDRLAHRPPDGSASSRRQRVSGALRHMVSDASKIGAQESPR